MNYIIYTSNADRLKEEILDRVSEKLDVNGNRIATWDCVETDEDDVVLVHTAEQWAEKGCIQLTPMIGFEELQARFHYWDDCEEQTNDDDKYMLGRLTELLLVHFKYFVDKIVIE